MKRFQRGYADAGHPLPLYSASPEAAADVPKDVRFLTLSIAFCLATSFIDIPLLKLSVSAPLMYMLFLNILRRPNGVKLRHGIFSVMIIFLFLSMAMSSVVNTLFGNATYTLISFAQTYARYAYWILCALIACGVFYRYQIGHSVSLAFTVGITCLGVLLIIDYLVFGGLSSTKNSLLTDLSKNDYAFQFSTFLPFLFYPIFFLKGKTRIWGIVGFIICLLAIVINTSRSAWGTTLLTIIIYSSLYGMIVPKRGYRLFIGYFAVGLTFWIFLMLPGRFQEAVEERY